MPIDLEVPVFGADAAFKAVESRVTRVELNATGSYPDGGLTPSVSDLERVANLNVKVRIMIRPRGPLLESEPRDFIYSDEEFAQMERDIVKFKETGLLNEARGDGFVFGILKEGPESNNPTDVRSKSCWVDKERCSRLVAAARPFKAVFHRAYDEIVSCDDNRPGIDERHAWRTGLDDLAQCGFDSILTSGGLGKAIQNLAMLDKIITRAESLGIEIIVGGGVRRNNALEICQRLKLNENKYSTCVHSACLSNPESEYVDAEEVTGILSQLG
ncbi:uncharacterized protein F4822DRAFT_163661 [Hypoxylon trugodes]|uniref:uncharacterized protein n=1 Tax=Hypoxylon trugodes TaxID=326681 RepID=UPI0021924EDA|nr:uncharacterized protein F4822DRAFT_163661 [Hypoxylon trugodes]KAI1390807.1 hypothetical protein F4822DRAFT_163661 [Hypoxylon trugodes]